jgi:hypothetical protein
VTATDPLAEVEAPVAEPASTVVAMLIEAVSATPAPVAASGKTSFEKMTVASYAVPAPRATLAETSIAIEAEVETPEAEADPTCGAIEICGLSTE